MLRLRSVFLAALALRLGCAVVTEFKPIFPAYYFTDAAIEDGLARQISEDWRAGRPVSLDISLAQRSYATWLAALYTAIGHHPLAAKAFNALFASAGVALIGAALVPAFGAGPAAAAAWVCALWPSHIFFTSQNFKDAPAFLLCWAALGALAVPRRALGRLLACASALALLALLRPYECLLAGAACAFGALVNLARIRRAAAVTLAATGLAAVLAAASPLATLSARGVIVRGDARYAGLNVLTPSGLAEVRRLRQESNTLFSVGQGHRVATTLFYGQRFDSWTDVALFIPKSAFFVLFMPLPGLYPLDGNLGRLLACLENLSLLVLAAVAVAGMRRRRFSGADAALLVFFGGMAAASALLEFDLGGASRHKIIYMPALFPFAFSWLGERRKPSEGKLKVFEVLECGGPGGTGNQVAAICNGLDPARFEVSLVYAVRPGASAEEYRALASGARQAHFVPEMVRELSPFKDATALAKLYSLFKREKPDVVHAHSSKAGVLARWAAWLAGVPRVFYTPHGYGFLQQDHSPAKRALYRGAEWATSWIGAVVAVSESEAAFARPLAWGRKVEVVSDPFLGTLPAISGPAPHDGLRVGACGRLTAARNPDAFITLSQRLTDSRNGLTCVWIGGGEQEDAARRHVENMNLHGRLEITGWLQGDEARRRMSALDVLVHYSRWDGLPNAVLEAMAQGLPVVASDVPGARDAVVHGETGFLAKNEVELLEYTLRLADDPELRRRLGAAGRKRVEAQFRLDAALARLEALYAGQA